MVLEGGRENRANTSMREGSISKFVGFYLNLRDLSSGLYTLAKRSSSATSDAQSTGTGLGRDQYMNRNVSTMGALRAPQPKAQKNTRPP